MSMSMSRNDVAELGTNDCVPKSLIVVGLLNHDWKVDGIDVGCVCGWLVNPSDGVDDARSNSLYVRL